MQITHEEAQKLIQYNADQALDSQQKAALFAHLNDCTECSTYACDIKDVETLLLSGMRRQWGLQPAPLSLNSLTPKGRPKIQLSISLLLATRMAIISMVCLALVFTAWQFTLSGRQTSGPRPAYILPVPTPSTWPTSTKITLQHCKSILYNVQANDTIESIADQFSTSKAEIMAINSMKTETVDASMKLMIPICNSTPTSTVRPGTRTTTYTPAIDSTISTPGG